MPITTRVLLLSFFMTVCFQQPIFSQSNNVDSLLNLIKSSPDSTKLRLNLQISKSYMGRNSDSIIFYADEALELAKDLHNKASIASALNLKGIAALYQSDYKEVKLENTALENKLQEQQLNEANFQLFVILFISIVTVGFVVTFYFLRSKGLIAEREAQELQVEALEKRLLELQLKHEGIEKTIDIVQINQELMSPLTEGEIDALQLSLKGLPNNEVAEKLFVPVNMVKFYLRKAYQKLGVKGEKEVFNYVTKSS